MTRGFGDYNTLQSSKFVDNDQLRSHQLVLFSLFEKEHRTCDRVRLVETLKTPIEDSKRTNLRGKQGWTI